MHRKPPLEACLAVTLQRSGAPPPPALQWQQQQQQQQQLLLLLLLLLLPRQEGRPWRWSCVEAWRAKRTRRQLR